MNSHARNLKRVCNPNDKIMRHALHGGTYTRELSLQLHDTPAKYSPPSFSLSLSLSLSLSMPRPAKSSNEARTTNLWVGVRPVSSLWHVTTLHAMHHNTPRHATTRAQAASTATQQHARKRRQRASEPRQQDEVQNRHRGGATAQGWGGANRRALARPVNKRCQLPLTSRRRRLAGLVGDVVKSATTRWASRRAS